MFSSLRHTYGLLANLALAVLKCHHFQLTAPHFSPKAGKAKGNLCLMPHRLVPKGGTHAPEIHLPTSPMDIKVLRRAYRLCILKNLLIAEFNIEISSVSLNEAKEKQKKFPLNFNWTPLNKIWNYCIKKIQNALACLAEQGSARTDLKHIRDYLLKQLERKD